MSNDERWRSAFWDDHVQDMQNPEYSEAFFAARLSAELDRANARAEALDDQAVQASRAWELQRSHLIERADRWRARAEAAEARAERATVRAIRAEAAVSQLERALAKQGEGVAELIDAAVRARDAAVSGHNGHGSVAQSAEHREKRQVPAAAGAVEVADVGGSSPLRSTKEQA